MKECRQFGSINSTTFDSVNHTLTECVWTQKVLIWREQEVDLELDQRCLLSHENPAALGKFNLTNSVQMLKEQH